MSVNRSTRQIVDGFAIGGFRSFYGSTVQRIGPLGKINLITGPNNSGKSNIIRAAQQFLPGLNRLAPQLDPLDTPDVPDGHLVPPLEFGIGLRLNGLNGANSVLEFMQMPQLITSPGAIAFAEAIGASSPSGDGLLWLTWQYVGGEVDWTSDLVSRVRESLDAAHQNLLYESREVFGEATEGGPDATEQNLRRFLGALTALLPRVGEVRLVPSTRSIVSQGQGTAGNTLNSLSGNGLPNLLQALQAPTATTYRSDKKKFDTINRFFREVLEDPTAEIMVPYNAATIHVSMDGRVLPLANLGAGLSQLLVIATAATWYDNTIVCLEEPEMNLHPLLLRKLMRYLAKTDNQYLVATHSAQLLDDPNVAVLRVDYTKEGGTTVAGALGPAERARIARDLGYRASDLLQANAVIWVEGPSDVVYMRYWLRSKDEFLVEGIHYSIMWYGGDLRSRLTTTDADQMTTDDSGFVLISLLNINRHMILVMDSDKTSNDAPLSANKERLLREFDEQRGGTWVTAGREIENYVPHDLFMAAVSRVHKTFVPDDEANGKYDDRYRSIKGADKVRIAQEIVDAMPEAWLYDLESQVAQVVRFIRQANHMPLPVAVPDAPHAVAAGP